MNSVRGTANKSDNVKAVDEGTWAIWLMQMIDNMERFRVMQEAIVVMNI